MNAQQLVQPVLLVTGWLALGPSAWAQPNVATNAAAPPAAPARTAPKELPNWLTRPLSVAEAVNLALQQNSTILKSKNDLEAAYGVVLQTRAIVLPKVRASGSYDATDSGLIEKFPFEAQGQNTNVVGVISIDWPSQKWNTGIQVVQSVYEGGRMRSALRSARLIREQALLQHQAVVNDVLTDVRVAYADVLTAAEQIVVRQKSVELLQRELEDATRRFKAGTVPRFNVLRAEVELANAQPKLSQARNAWRIAKNALANLLGADLPASVGEDIPLQVTGRLEAEPYEMDLPKAVAAALERRPELNAMRKAESLRQEGIVNAKSGYKPSLELFTGYQAHSSSFHSDLTSEVHGWNAGAQFVWNLWDGRLTEGRIREARALHDRSRNELDELARRIDLEVRTAYSTFLEAREVLAATDKSVEQGEEALRLANARAEAGTSTQLDVLTAETSLTDARTTRNVALRAYVVARVRFERAIGLDVQPPASPPAPSPPVVPSGTNSP